VIDLRRTTPDPDPEIRPIEPVERPQRRNRLPLFPLPIVLLPGAALPLHIFEPRYRSLVSDCLEGDRRFGLVCHDWDERGPFLSEEGRVGCVAEIVEHESLEDGRSLIVVRGVERFRIVDGVESESLYFEALVTPYRDVPPPSQEGIVRRRRDSIELFQRVVASLDDTPENVPDLEPELETSFVLAQTIDIEHGWLQGLLERRREAERLDQLDRVFRAVLRG
jgi:ATP-dependent Lon protease